MSIKRKVSMVVGLAQSMIGAFATVFAFILYHNFLGIQTVFNATAQDVVLYVLIIIVFGLLSIISGLFLINGTLKKEN